MLTDSILDRIKSISGLNVSRASFSYAMKIRMKQCHLTDKARYQSMVLQSDDEFAALLEQLVVPETWFFREPAAFAAAVQFAKAHLSRNRGPIRILSVPCSSGEEPYSIAMAMLDAGVDPSDCEIDAMDISKQALSRATQAVYNANSFRTADLGFRDRHFKDTKLGYVLHENVRNMVAFHCANLLALDSVAYRARFNIIFSRNLLIYFDLPTQQMAIERLNTLLDDDGILFVGYAEVMACTKVHFISCTLPNIFALKKRGTQADTIAQALSAQPRVATRSVTQIRGARDRALQSLDTTAVRRAPTPAPAPPHQPSAAATDAGAPSAAGDQNPGLVQARQYADQGDHPGAIKALTAHLQLVPDCAEAHFIFGLIDASDGRPERAEENFKKALYLEPNSYEVLCHLALLLEKQGRQQEAQALKSRAARVLTRQGAGADQPLKDHG